MPAFRLAYVMVHRKVAVKCYWQIVKMQTTGLKILIRWEIHWELAAYKLGI